MTQEALAHETGVPLATYRRLERGEIPNPRLGWLVNCSLILQAPLQALLRDYEYSWVPLKNGPEGPPADRQALWDEGRFPNVPKPAFLRDHGDAAYKLGLARTPGQ
jgi:transcriptional regulator with XRE-family HTH domain